MADLLGMNLSGLAEQQLLRREGNCYGRVMKSRSLLDQLRSGSRGTDPEATRGPARRALENNLAEVKKLFVEDGSTTDNKVEFVRSNQRTTAGDYDADITAAAQRAELLGSLDLSGGIAVDQTLTITEADSDNRIAEVQLQAGDDTDAIVAKLNAALASQVAEVRRATVGNTTDGTTAITEATTFGQLNGAGVVNGDSIRIQGTTHDGNSVQREFTITDVDTDTVGDLLAEVRAVFGNKVSANLDSEGRIFITDNQVGPSNLTLALGKKTKAGVASTSAASRPKRRAASR